MKTRINIKVHARARRSGLAGKLGESYKIEVACPPVRGEANDACLELLARELGVPRSAVRLISGSSSRTKVVEIEGMTAEQVDRELNR